MVGKYFVKKRECGAHGDTSALGSFFAGVYALWHWRKVWSSDHSFIRKLVFMVENLYNTYNLIFSWFAIVSDSL